VPDLPYREPLPVKPDPYMVAWAELRRRRIIGRVAFGFNVLLVPLLARSLLRVQAEIDQAFQCDPGPCHVFPGLLRERADLLHERAVVLWAACLLVAIWAAASIYRQNLRCPHCGWHFARRRRKCRHCGIPVGTPRSAVVDAERRASNVVG
jgi:hypothetical protein